MTDFIAAELIQFKHGLPRWGGFFRLETTPIVRLWLGAGAIEPGVNALDPLDGGSYRGFGQLLDLPGFTQFCDGGSEKKSFVISGIPPTVFAEIAPSLAEQQLAIAGAPVSAGYAVMGQNWEMLGPVRWQWHGFADVLGARIGVAEGESPRTFTIELSAADWMVRRGAGRRDYWTDQQHQAEFPGDKFFEMMVRNAQGVSKVWPPA